MVNLCAESRPPSLDYILKKSSDEKTLVLFNSIATDEEDRPIKLKEVNLTAKQYYVRISSLMEAGLIKRYKGKYSLTLFGRVVYDSLMIISKALSYYTKLRVIESIEMSNGGAFPKEELMEVINALIDSHQIKDMIIKSNFAGSAKDDNKSILVAEEKPSRH
jgi:predicted transcriptional regulator